MNLAIARTYGPTPDASNFLPATLMKGKAPPKMRCMAAAFNMPNKLRPNPSVNTDVPHAGAARAAAGRRLASFH